MALRVARVAEHMEGCPRRTCHLLVDKRLIGFCDLALKTYTAPRSWVQYEARTNITQVTSCHLARSTYNKTFYNTEELDDSENIFFKIKIIPFGELSSPTLN